MKEKRNFVGWISKVFKGKKGHKYGKESAAMRVRLDGYEERAKKLEHGEYEETSMAMRARIDKYTQKGNLS